MDDEVITFHEVTAGLVTCGRCGCVVESSERGRRAHRRWHAGDTAIDLRDSAVLSER